MSLADHTPKASLHAGPNGAMGAQPPATKRLAAKHPALNRAALERVRLPIAEARGLPNAHYIDPEVWEIEKQELFFKQWAAIGFAKDVPEVGDANPITFLGQPLLVVRGRDRQVRVFQNTCRHRGMILVEQPTKIKGVITCPYHAWCYGLDGKLRNTPHVGGVDQNSHPDIDPDALGLCEISSAVWRDVIFVNISGDAPPFDVYAAEAKRRWADFEKPLYYAGSDSAFGLELKANWKLAVENYCESYHLPFIHPGLNSYSRIEDHYHIEAPLEFSGQGTTVYRQIKDETGQVFPDHDGLDAKWDTAAEYIAFYPNVLFGVHRDHSYALLLEPVAPNHTREHTAIYYTQPEATGEDYAALRRKNAEQWRGVFVEDIGVCEGMQRGRHGTHFDGGKFSSVMDNPTHCFHDWAAAQLLKD